jgi:hypothetical protein
MRVNAQFINTGSVDVTLTITMPLSDWKRMSEQLPTRWPCSKLGEAINRVVRKLESNVADSDVND